MGKYFHRQRDFFDEIFVLFTVIYSGYYGLIIALFAFICHEKGFWVDLYAPEL